jgi:hypothetical protein
MGEEGLSAQQVCHRSGDAWKQLRFQCGLRAGAGDRAVGASGGQSRETVFDDCHLTPREAGGEAEDPAVATRP